MASPETQLRAIFQAGLDRVDPYRLVADELRRRSFDHRRILVLAAGKAAAPMARAAEDVLGGRIAGGLVVTKYGHGEPLSRLELAETGHPTPDAAGERAARRLAELAAGADADTLALLLVSGGGSALLPLPGPGVTLAAKQAATAALLACGAEIGEINCVRKHLSALKGGRLLRLLAPARCLALILSDVVGDRLDTIASGLTAPDPTTVADAQAVLDRYGITLPGPLSETVKPGDPVLALAENVIVGSNRIALEAARAKAAELGYRTEVLPEPLTGEARDAGRMLCVRARALAPGTCLLAGGETVVTLTGSGLGGRNQELALAFLAALGESDDIHFLSAATDGGDGPTDAAGAFASAGLARAAQAAGLSMDHALADNDSYRFFDRVDGLLRTGPTRTNVCDLQLAIAPLPLGEGDPKPRPR